MEWEFLIPLKKDDLTHFSSERQYYVRDVWPPSDCLLKLKECQMDINTNGCEAILVHFDTLFSFLFDSSQVTLNDLQELYDTTIEPLLTNLTDMIQNCAHHDDPSLRLQTVNTIKMTIYIYSLHLRAYEEKIAVLRDNLIGDVKKPRGPKGKGTKQKTNEEQWDWNDRKRVCLINIFQILQEKLNSFWVSNRVEEAFINLIGSCCYKVLENPDISQAKQKPLRDSTAQILGTLVTHYNHVLTFIPRVVQLLRHHEHTASALSGTVLILINDFNCTTLLQKLMRELHYGLSEEDSPALAKATAAFITEIAEVDAMLFIPSMKYLCLCLGLEAYIVRNAVLTAFSEIVLKCHNTDLTDERKKIRNQLVKILHRHMLDINSYVRSKVLQIWTKLASAHAIPKTILNDVLESAKESISDKSSLVCRHAIQLFKTMLKDNPFGGKFVLSDLKKTLKEEKALLKQYESAKILTRDEAWGAIEGQLIFSVTNAVNDDNEEAKDLPSAKSVDVMDVVAIISNLIQKNHFADAYKLLKQSEQQFPESHEIRCSGTFNEKVEYYVAALKKIFMTGPCPEACASGTSREDYENQKAVVEFIEESISFALLVQSAMVEIQGILRSKTPTEAQEAIDFFSVAYQFGVDGSGKIVRDMLNLVWSIQPGIKEAVASAYKSLYLNSSQPTPQLVALQVTNRLVKLVLELSMEQKIALELLVSEWMKADLLNKHFINALGVKYSNDPSEGNVNESIAAAIILDMVAGYNPAVASSNLPLFIEHGLNRKANMKMVQYTCDILSKMKDVKVDGLLTRYPANHEIFEKVSLILIDHFEDLDTIGFKNMAYSIINLIFDISANPEVVVDRLLLQMHSIIYPPDCINTTNSDGISERKLQKDHLWEKLFDVYGETMFRKWLFFDKFVYSSLKKCTTTGNDTKEEMIDEFESDNAMAADENLYARITDYCDHLVNEEQSLVAFIRKKVIQVCKEHKEIYSASLKISAAIAFAKLMMVSQKFCEDHIQLYVTLMEKSTEDGLRSSLILGFGDLLTRFPNVVEPWTNYLYNKLSESNITLRRNAVNVLCHLISREMVKVKGSIAKLCLCLNDPDQGIADQVLNIFMDLANKGNALYNVVPDIISRLSNPESDIKVDKERFEHIVGIILDLAVKERQNELLVEAICKRLKEATNEEQADNLAFCLGRMSYNERSLRKLCDFLPSLTEKLYNPDIYERISSLLSQCSKSSFKPQLKEIALEGISKVEEILDIKNPNSSELREDLDATNANPIDIDKPSTSKATVLPTPKRQPRTRGRPPGSTSKSSKKLKTPAKPKKSKAKPKLSSDDSEEDSNELKVFREKRPKRNKAQPIIEESSEEDGNSD